MTAAKQIANWASNVLVSGIVIVGAIVFGRQTIVWWRADDAGLQTRHAVDEVLGPGALAAENAVQLFEIGDFPFTFRRLQVAGEADEALANLRRYCGQAATESLANVTRLSVTPSPAERQALEHLGQQTPVAESPGQWQMFENPRPLPMVLVTTGSPQTGNSERRVLSWGLAFPRGVTLDESPATWTLFVTSATSLLAADDEAFAGHRSRQRWPMPPTARRTMLLRTEEGGALVAVTGTGGLVAWKSFVQDWAAREAWSVATNWQAIGDVWRLRLENAAHQTLDVQLVARPDDKILGMYSVTPPRTDRKSK